MAIGVAHGIAIHEDDADVGRNPTIYSREQSGKEPYLLVELDGAKATEPPPKPPTELQVIRNTSTSATLTLRPATGFAYEVQVDGKRLGQHNIPFVTSASQQAIHLRDRPGIWKRKVQSSSSNCESYWETIRRG